MKLKALTGYDEPKVNYGDCILLHNRNTIIVYDCGHVEHASTVIDFLESRTTITNVHIVISHNDSDHTKGIDHLFDFLSDTTHETTVYTSLYLKHVKKVLEILDDERRTPAATRERILKIFDNIAEIVENAQGHGFAVKNAVINTEICIGALIVGPTEDEFAEVVAKAVETMNDDSTASIASETVMNAACIQLSCDLENDKTVLLCADASPEYLHNLGDYRVVQLPHHGKLASAETVFENISANIIGNYTFLVSDNTGDSNGGSDKLMSSPICVGKDIRNTKNGKDIEIGIPVYPTIKTASEKHGICAGS